MPHSSQLYRDEWDLNATDQGFSFQEFAGYNGMPQPQAISNAAVDTRFGTLEIRHQIQSNVAEGNAVYRVVSG
ncbi:MAG TPA: hypothetical protein VGT08_21070 [Terracidiphilus sp.]|nr:hypothetical protein [Terracidiphilus sp.]